MPKNNTNVVCISEISKMKTDELQDYLKNNLALHCSTLNHLETISLSISTLIDRDDISKEQISSYISRFLCYIKSYYHSVNQLHQNEHVISVFKKMFETNILKPTILEIQLFFSYSAGINIIELYMSTMKIIPKDCILAIMNTSKPPEICDELLKKYTNYEIDVDIFNKACELKLINFVKNEISNNKFKPNQESLYCAIRSGSLDIAHMLILCGCKLNVKCLEQACQYRYIEIIEYILNNKITPTKECFNSIFSCITNNMLAFYGHRSRHYDDYDYVKLKICTKIIDMFVIAGYKITYDDAILATKNKTIINNFQSFNVTLDDNFLEICSEVDIDPVIYGVLPTLKYLQKECCKSGNIDKIRKIINNGVMPDIICLHNACVNKNNAPVIKLLISKGIDPDIKSIKILSNVIGNTSLTFLVDTYVKQKLVPIKKSIENAVYKVTNTNIILPTVNKIEDNAEDNINNYTNSKTNDVDDDISKNEVDDFVDIPTDYDFRLKRSYYDDILKLLSVNPSEYSFIDIRKEFMSYSIKNNIINNNIIKLNSAIKKLLKNNKYKSSYYIADFDRLIYNIINPSIVTKQRNISENDYSSVDEIAKKYKKPLKKIVSKQVVKKVAKKNKSNNNNSDSNDSDSNDSDSDDSDSDAPIVIEKKLVKKLKTIGKK